jgi:very-short-patch-repair endonuclease
VASPRVLRPFLDHRGILNRRTAEEAGWRPDALRRAVRREGLTALGRSWIVDERATPEVAWAAELGGWVTCLTAAAMLGWWQPPAADDRPHIVLPRSARRKPEGVHAHWSIGLVPRSSRSLLDPVENVLFLVASCVPFDDALAVWESALRVGSVTREHLALVPWRGEQARRLADAATHLSDSGLESLMAGRLRRRGVRVVQQPVIGGRPVDGLVGARLVYQIDGFAHHSDPRQRRSDIAHDRLLRSLGYTVLRFDYREIVHEWPRVEAEIIRAMVHGLHLAH